jgi:hypothetical protein
MVVPRLVSVKVWAEIERAVGFAHQEMKSGKILAGVKIKRRALSLSWPGQKTIDFCECQFHTQTGHCSLTKDLHLKRRRRTILIKPSRCSEM